MSLPGTPGGFLFFLALSLCVSFIAAQLFFSCLVPKHQTRHVEWNSTKSLLQARSWGMAEAPWLANLRSHSVAGNPLQNHRVRAGWNPSALRSPIFDWRRYFRFILTLMQWSLSYFFLPPSDNSHCLPPFTAAWLSQWKRNGNYYTWIIDTRDFPGSYWIWPFLKG